MASDQAPGTRDVTYDLISVIYHALQGGDTAHTYIRDAETAGDHELAGFFQEVEQQSQQLAARVKELLAQRLSGGSS
jgi:hypothetical protein